MMKLPPKPEPNRVLRLFRQGYNTYDIARILTATEPSVTRALHQAMDARHAKDTPALPAQRQSALEDKEDRGHVPLA